jgi:hypothetical protein
MDQVLKDLMIAAAEEDQQIGIEGMQGDEGEDEINEIVSTVYKIRPWGGDTCNMRDLNPTVNTLLPNTCRLARVLDAQRTVSVPKCHGRGYISIRWPRMRKIEVCLLGPAPSSNFVRSGAKHRICQKWVVILRCIWYIYIMRHLID